MKKSFRIFYDCQFIKTMTKNIYSRGIRTGRGGAPLFFFLKNILTYFLLSISESVNIKRTVNVATTKGTNVTKTTATNVALSKYNRKNICTCFFRVGYLETMPNKFERLYFSNIKEQYIKREEPKKEQELKVERQLKVEKEMKLKSKSIMEPEVRLQNEEKKEEIDKTGNMDEIDKTENMDEIEKKKKTKEGNKERNKEEKTLYLVSPRGFCKGVSRAIETVEECLKLFKTGVYVKHKIVHNHVVCKDLEEKGAIFIEDINEVPDGKVLIYSAHGVPPQIRELAKKKNLIEIDATCPLVNKVHVYVKQKAKEGYKIILIGHKNHVEIIGTYNEAPESTYIIENEQQVDALNFDKNQKLFYTTQTTLSLDDCAVIVNKLKKKFPNIKTIPSGSICYATTNRQQALNKIVPLCDLTIVVGSDMSSNAKKLVYSSQIRNVPAVLLNTVQDFKDKLLENVQNLAITSAASTPEAETQKFVKLLTNPPYNFKLQVFDGVEEKVPKWKLPKNLLELKEKQ